MRKPGSSDACLASSSVSVTCAIFSLSSSTTWEMELARRSPAADLNLLMASL